ncbi:hypothetical protein CTI14_72035, partial [Methylobacterium radiotolerans]
MADDALVHDMAFAVGARTGQGAAYQTRSPGLKRLVRVADDALVHDMAFAVGARTGQGAAYQTRSPGLKR